jgi:hypothetical protein
MNENICMKLITIVPTTLFFDWMRHPDNLGTDLCVKRAAYLAENFHDFIEFQEAAAAGKLPNYSFVDPKYVGARQ